MIAPRITKEFAMSEGHLTRYRTLMQTLQQKALLLRRDPAITLIDSKIANKELTFGYL